jgi:type I restriction enzyme S subunit
MKHRIPLNEVCKIYDGPHATPHKTETGPIYLGIDAITDNGKINPAGFAHLSEEDYIKWTKRVTPQYGDIVFSYEATLGRYALIPENFYGCLGRRLAIIRNTSSSINTKWLYYYFLSPEWKAFIKSKIVKGSTVNRISVEDFPDYTIPNMKIDIQNRIEKILSAIDNRIDLNLKINDNLRHQSEMVA